MYEEERTDGATTGVTGFAIGLACGAAIGAALALMYAPKPGAEMRRQIADQTGRLRRKASEGADRARARANSAYNGASDAFSEIVERGRGAINVGREAFRKARPHDRPAQDVSTP